jgi:hypothetical protein
MKSKLFVLLSLVLLISCTNQNLKPITDDEKASIRLEIVKHLDIIADDFNNMNFDKAMSLSLNSPEYRFINTNGTILSYDEEIKAIKTLPDYFKAFKDYNYVVNQINILSPEIAVATITYSVKLIYKDDRIENHPKTAATSIYKKIDNQWMCIYWHESSSGPEEVISNN